MQILVFEPDPLIGEDLRDSARSTGARVRYVRTAKSAKAALEKNGRGVIVLMSGRSINVHKSSLSSVFDEMETRLVLFAPGDKIPPQILPEALLPEPFSEADVANALRELLPGK